MVRSRVMRPSTPACRRGRSWHQPAASSATTGSTAIFTYTNNAGATHGVHAHPVRLIHIAGEWHLIAWAPDVVTAPGRLKQYRLSRIAAPSRSERSPPGCPLTGLRAEAAALLRDAFRATHLTHQATVSVNPRVMSEPQP